MELQNKTALITGSTAGIGADTAQLFAAEGAHVIVTGRDVSRGEAVVKQIEADGGTARFIHSDLEDLASLQNLAEQAGLVDILVNNAGIFLPSPSLDQTLDTYEASFNLNVRAPYFLTTALLPKMIENGGGTVVNISTMVASVAMPGAAVYSATKAAVESLTRTWAAEFAAAGIRVNAVAPGPIGTEMVLEKMSEEQVNFISSTTVLKRLGTTREISNAVLFLASDRSSYVTGTTLHADAGRTIA